MPLTAPTGLWLSTLPVVPNNRNQLSTFLSDVATTINGFSGTATTYPTGTNHMAFTSLDSTYPNWTISQYYFDHPHASITRHDVLLTLGYNWIAPGQRVNNAEPAIFLQMETYDTAADGTTELVAGGWNYQHTNGTNVRPHYFSIIRSSGENHNSFTGAIHHFLAQDDTTTIVHMTRDGTVRVGIATQANANTNFHLKGKALFESGTGSANNKFWDFDYGAGDTFAFRAVNDAYGAAGAVFTVARSGTTVSSFTLATLLKLSSISTYANNAAAVAGGLGVGSVYQTSSGELRIVV